MRAVSGLPREASSMLILIHAPRCNFKEKKRKLLLVAVRRSTGKEEEEEEEAAARRTELEPTHNWWGIYVAHGRWS